MFADITQIVLQLVGVGAFISALVNVLKLVKVVKPGTSAKWIKGINLFVWLTVAVVMYLGYLPDWLVIDKIFSDLAILLALVLQLMGSKLFYAVAKGTPILGHSFPDIV